MSGTHNQRSTISQNRGVRIMSSDNSPAERFVEENRKAEEAITEHNLPEAAEILVKIVDEDPQNARAYNNMGIISWAQKCWEDAYTMFLKSVSLDITYADGLVNLFDAALKLKKIPEIIPWFESAHTTDTSNEEIALLLDTMRSQGDEIYVSKRALSIGTYNPLIEEAKKELETGNVIKAMELFLKVNDESGPDAAALYGLGIVSFYQKRYNDAVVMFIESLKINPLDPDTYLNLLDAAQACNRTGDAVTVFQTYRKEYPELALLDNHFNL